MLEHDSGLVSLRTPDELASAYATILEPSFPPEELISLGELTQSVADEKASVWAIDVDGESVAVAVVQEPTPGVELLLYLAARADQRGTGAGGRMMHNLLEGVRQRRPSMLLAEVEHPAYHPVHPEYGDPSARMRFYSRFGARIIDVPYFQAPIDVSSPPVYGMLLIALEVDPAAESDGRVLPTAGLDKAVLAMIEGADAAATPVDALLAAAQHPDGVRLLPFDRLSEAAVVQP